MIKWISLLAMSAVLLIAALGCQDDSNLLDSRSLGSAPYSLAAALVIPEGATITSATLYLWVSQAPGQTVNVHMVTAPWEEMTVTWDNFGGSYDAAVQGSITPTMVDWYTVDLTALVTAWFDGTYENYGILLDQVEEVYPRTEYHSRENSFYNPYLEVCYTTNGDSDCEELPALADAYIWERFPTMNLGDQPLLYTGWQSETSLEKQSLLIFDLIVEPPSEGCTNTIGYWKNHAGFGPQDDMVTALLPIWLGNDGGLKSLAVTDAGIAVDVLKMKTYGDPSNGITKLYAQLLGAKLNIANGASYGDVADIISDADDFLADHDYMDWAGLSEEQQEMVLDWMEMLDDYNNGDIGPGHCDDFVSATGGTWLAK
ncbi:MAG: DNRLRE domain-containing protein [Candidatus Zixiibacteriota bacterium]|nr:MAG: DNRLRE domain-containing protein [candidate division Zixibacteria bacterium]